MFGWFVVFGVTCGCVLILISIFLGCGVLRLLLVVCLVCFDLLILCLLIFGFV